MQYLIKYKLFETQSKEEIVKQASAYKSLLDLKMKNGTLYHKVMTNNLTNSVFPKLSKWTKE